MWPIDQLYIELGPYHLLSTSLLESRNLRYTVNTSVRPYLDNIYMTLFETIETSAINLGLDVIFGLFVVLESIKLHFEHSQERPPLMLLCYRDAFHNVRFLKFLSDRY